MATAPVYERLRYDPEQDLSRVLDAFHKGQVPCLDTGLEPHFAIARAKHDAFVNHKPVLALSVGGTNHTAMLAEMVNGEFVVHRCIRRPNPVVDTPVREFLDELLLGDEAFAGYLRQADPPLLGVSLAINIVDGVPVHPNKVPHIIGLVCRNFQRDGATHHFGRNFNAWCESHGLAKPRMRYQGDGIIAHLGAVTLSDVQPEDKTCLHICGSGMSNADEKRFVVTGQILFPGQDPDLYPPAETENVQYQYMTAGKGLFGLMARAIRQRAEEPGSALAEQDVENYFATGPDSRHVCELWESTLPEGDLSETVAEIRDRVPAPAFAELQALACKIMPRAISCIANCTLGTIAAMGRADNGLGHRVYWEGSIALNSNILPRVEAEMTERCNHSKAFAAMGYEAPLPPRFEGNPARANPAEGLCQSEADRADITTLGAAAMAMADSLL
jgi:hypothetical protein